MSIAYVWRPIKSIGKDWIWVMTSSALAAVLAWSGLLGYTSTHHWVSWTILLSSLLWAFVHSWNREHERAEHYKALLLQQYVAMVGSLRNRYTPAVIPRDGFAREEKFYFEHIEAEETDRELLQQAIIVFRTNNPERYCTNYAGPGGGLGGL